MHKKTFLFRKPIVIALMLCTPLAFGGEREDRAARYYEDALVRYEKDDAAGAIIQLRNALQQDPNMLAAQVLIGKAHLRKGEPSAAEAAFQKAIALGVDRSEIVVPLAQAYLDQGDFNNLLDRIPAAGLPVARKVEILLLRAQAQLEIGRPREAEEGIAEARQLDPKSVGPIIAQAQIAIQQDRWAEAAKLADLAVGISGDDPAAWNMKASVLHLKGDLKGALAGYSKALEVAPKYVDARIARAGLYLDLNREKEGEQDIEQLLQDHPKEPRAIYLRSVLQGRRGNTDGVRESLGEIAKLLDPIPVQAIKSRSQVLLLGGLANYGLNRQQQAKGYFEAYIKLFPSHAGARKLLGSILVGERKPREALEVLEPAARAYPNDPQILSLMAEAQMADREYAKAAALLARAAELGPDAAGTETRLGLSLLGAGRQAQSIEHLKRANAKGASDNSAGVALAMLHLKRGDAKKAVEIVDGLLRREPKNPALLNLAGIAKAAAKDFHGARVSYEKALAVDPKLKASILNLVRIDLAEGKTAAARGRIQGLLQKRPKDAQAMFEMAKVEESAGKLDEADRWLEKARAANRQDPAAGIYLVALSLRRGNTERALSVAKELDALFADRLDVLATVAQAHIAAGQPGLARVVLNRMTRVAEFDASAQHRIALLQLAAGNKEGALYSLEKSLSGDPTHLPTHALMAEVEIQSGSIAKAEQRARTIIDNAPASAVGYRILGDTALARKDYSEATAQYRTALAKEESTDLIVRLFRAQLESGALAKGIETLDAWLARHPDDLVAAQALAEGQLRAGNLAAAGKSFEALQRRRPDDAMLANHLANVLSRQGEREAALSAARRAYELSPNSPVTNDTLGWLLVRAKQVDTGLKHLREARLRNPADAEIKYHLGAALAATGRKDEAAKELRDAVAKGGFDELEDARKLLRELSAK